VGASHLHFGPRPDSDLIRCWEPKVLKQMSKHYKTNEALPAELIEKLVRRCAGCVMHFASFWTDSRNPSAVMSMSVSSTCGSFSSHGLTIGCIRAKVSWSQVPL
jgi:hypothetical protein